MIQAAISHNVEQWPSGTLRQCSLLPKEVSIEPKTPQTTLINLRFLKTRLMFLMTIAITSPSVVVVVTRDINTLTQYPSRNTSDNGKNRKKREKCKTRNFEALIHNPPMSIWRGRGTPEVAQLSSIGLMLWLVGIHRRQRRIWKILIGGKLQWLHWNVLKLLWV